MDYLRKSRRSKYDNNKILIRLFQNEDLPFYQRFFSIFDFSEAARDAELAMEDEDIEEEEDENEMEEGREEEMDTDQPGQKKKVIVTAKEKKKQVAEIIEKAKEFR